MKVIKVIPRGYCHGVVSALDMVVQVAHQEEIPKPIHIIGQIVHNQKLTEAFLKLGVVTLEGNSREEILDQVDHGTVVITAHGINPNLIKKAKSKGLNVVDATCKDVYKTHHVIKEYLQKDYQVIYIGKRNHPEPEGALGIDEKNIFLIEKKEEVDTLVLKDVNRVAVTNQTTMSIHDVKEIIEYIQKKFPKVKIVEEICPATRERQEAVAMIPKDVEFLVVVGDPKSNNTNKLVEIGKKQNQIDSIRVNSIEDLDVEFFKQQDFSIVAVTSGASTPTVITTEVIKWLEEFDKKNPQTWENKSKINLGQILPRARRK